VTVYALRKDGFAGDIDLELKNAPAGFALSGAHIPGAADSVRFTLAMPRSPVDDPVLLSLEGKALIDGKDVRRPAVPAEYMMQAFANMHLVPVSDWMVAVVGRANRGLGFPVLNRPVRLVVGSKTEIRLSGPGKFVSDQLVITLSEGPAGITVQKVRGEQGLLFIEFMVDRNLAKVGLKGNLILDLFTERTPTATADGKRPPKRRVFMGTLPAIPFEVVKG
jgi:hypothetical protein